MVLKHSMEAISLWALSAIARAIWVIRRIHGAFIQHFATSFCAAKVEISVTERQSSDAYMFTMWPPPGAIHSMHLAIHRCCRNKAPFFMTEAGNALLFKKNPKWCWGLEKWWNNGEKNTATGNLPVVHWFMSYVELETFSGGKSDFSKHMVVWDCFP